MQGLHLTADLSGCAPGRAALTDIAALRTTCLDAVAGAGLLAVNDCFHAFGAPGGVTGVVLLAESHLAVHTWPEFGSVTVDVFVCNLQADNGERAEAALQAVVAAFSPSTIRRQRLRRGPTPTAPDTVAAGTAA